MPCFAACLAILVTIAAGYDARSCRSRRGCCRWRRAGPGRTPAARPPAARSSRSWRGCRLPRRTGGLPARRPGAGPAAALPRGDELVVPGVDGGREDERVGGVEVPRGVADDAGIRSVAALR